MVARIEKEVEASIMEIDPCFIDPLQRFRFILNVKLIQQFTFKFWDSFAYWLKMLCNDRCRTWSD